MSSTYELDASWNDDGWYRMHRAAARDLDISIEALGALAWFASHKPGMRMNDEFVQRGLRCKRDRKRKIIAELTDAGYIEPLDRERSGGKFGEQNYRVFPVRAERRALITLAAGLGDDDPNVSAGETRDGKTVSGVTCGNTDADMDSGATEGGFTGGGGAVAGKTATKEDTYKREIDLEREKGSPPPNPPVATRATGSAAAAETKTEDHDPADEVARAVLAEIVNPLPATAHPSNADKRTLVELVAERVRTGWSAEALRSQLGGGNWHNVGSVYAVLVKRIRALAPAPPRKPPTAPAQRPPTWCGRCERGSRRVIEDDGSLGAPCRACSPKPAETPAAAFV